MPGAARRGVGFGIGGDADFEIGDPLQPGDQIGRVGIAAGMRRVAVSAGGRPTANLSVWRVAAQGDDIAGTGAPPHPGYTVSIQSARRDARLSISPSRILGPA